MKLKTLLLLPLLIVAMTVFGQEEPKRCTALTTKNVRCKNPAKTGKTLCHVHGDPKCGAPTSKGTPCKMSVKEGQKCWRHKD
jgi:hypothetical protein